MILPGARHLDLLTELFGATGVGGNLTTDTRTALTHSGQQATLFGPRGGVGKALAGLRDASTALRRGRVAGVRRCLMSVGRICSRNVDLVDENENIRDAACRMRDREVGMLVAVDRACRPVGLVSDRDLVVRAIAEGCDLGAPVRVLMSPAPRTIAEEAPIESALSLMVFAAVRRLPVVDRTGKLVGVVALDDVVALLAEELSQVGKVLGRQAPCRQCAEESAPAHGGAK